LILSDATQETTMSTSTPNRVLPATLAMGTVGLSVAELARSLDFYATALGLEVLERGRSEATLGSTGRALMELVEVPGARPSMGHTGLFHVALRVPTRVDLAYWVTQAARNGAPLAGMSDHFVSEAIYLQDPDGHGIEIYHDRPRAVWEGQADRMATLPLDLESLLDELAVAGDPDYAGFPPGSDVGHVHFKVADIPDTLGFYRDILGFDLMATYGRDAVFLAAGGYHHHVGANVWQSRGATPPSPDAAALRYATIMFPDGASRDAAAARVSDGGRDVIPDERGEVVLDPSGNALVLAVTEAGV
jgi:catechol 2,3-dioxygenase